MQTLNGVLPRFSTRLAPFGSRLAATGLNEVEQALAAVHQRSAERLVEIVFGLRALVGRATKRLWQHAALWLNPRLDWHYEQHLQGAVDCADLEERMRSWDRRKHGWH